MNMKNIICAVTVIITMACGFLIQAQPVNNQIVIGSIDSLQSKILNEERKIWVYVPNSVTANVSDNRKYPVIYLLDGSSNFYSVMGLVERLGETMIVPEMIIVGIPNTDRFRDLTPSKPEADSTFPFPPTVGGGKAFTSFLETELIPYIDSTYPTAPYRMMIGHSLGDLMVINTLLHHSHLFNSYLAIDPSLWWDKDLMVKQADSVFRTVNYKSKSLYLAMANNGIPDGRKLDDVMSDTSEDTANARPMLLFSDILESGKSDGLRWKFHYYPDDNHNSVTTIATYDALRFFFNKYSIPLSYLYGRKIADPSFRADSVIADHFTAASGQLGYSVLPPESFVNEEAYNMMYNDEMENAYRLFNLNIRNYPNSYNAYDSMGDYYMAMNDKENALLFCAKSLEIKEFPATRKKLGMLKGK